MLLHRLLFQKRVSGFQILQSGSLIGEIPFNWKNGHHIHIHQTNKKYWIRGIRTGGMLSSNKTYDLLEDGVKSIIAIHYSWKKWKENIEIEILENNDDSYELIIYGLFLMRQQQQGEAAGSTVFIGG